MTEPVDAARPDVEPYPPDPSFDRYARMVRATLGVPIAIVSLVEADRQVFPGAEGLPTPLAERRSTPLSSSFCQHVVADQAPLVVADARVEPRHADNPLIAEHGMIAYAGFPLVDPAGVVVGALCAIDTEPHDWTRPQLDLLADLAQACSAELSERAHRSTAEAAVRAATESNRVLQVLLSLSEILAGTRALPDVAEAVQRIAVTGLGAERAGIWLVRDGLAEPVAPPGPAAMQVQTVPAFRLDAANPVGTAVATRRAVYFERHSVDVTYDPTVPDTALADGSRDQGAKAFLPLTVAGEVLGCLVVGWAGTRDFDERDKVLLAALTAYTAQAVHRALLLRERASVASTLQNAMLTELPSPRGLELVARYRTAAHDERVGGDWYDVVVSPAGAAALVIGDVVGHDTAASAVMGQLRSMLRAFVWLGGDGPAGIMQQLDRSARDLEVGTLATTVLAVLEPGPDERVLRWTNAGHPAPVVVDADGTVRSLDSGTYDCLLGVRPDWSRAEHSTTIGAGSTIVLFTDGLIESHGRDVDTGRDELVAALERLHDLPLADLVDGVIADLVGEHPEDDVAVLAARLVPTVG